MASYPTGGVINHHGGVYQSSLPSTGDLRTSLPSHYPVTPCPLYLRSNRDWFIWLHSLRSLHPLAYPYVDPDVARPSPLPEPGTKPRPTDIRSVEAIQLTRPISTTSTVADGWNAELSAFRSLSDGERDYYFENVREWEALSKEKKDIEEAVAHLIRDVLSSIEPQVRYLVLGSPEACYSVASGGRSAAGGTYSYVSWVRDGVRRLARRYRPGRADIGHWVQELGRPSDKDWENWVDRYLQLHWMGRCIGSEDMEGEKGIRMFLDSVEHLTETWARTWGKKIERSDRGLPDILDLAHDWRQWMEFRREHKSFQD